MKIFKSCFFLLVALISIETFGNPSRGLAEETEAKTIEGFLQGLSTIPDVVSRRDPFIVLESPFLSDAADMNLAFNPNAPVLERYPVEDYTLVAVLTGDEYPRALIRLPESESSKVLIVKQKDKLGNRGGIISLISKDSVVINESKKSPLGFVEKATYSLKVGKDSGGGEGKASQ
ncbi:MAG: pilus assembly protein PilP [Oligoflexia bacterium]|nr:pilus assembly protein PilP [Oligoflexia bacterium]